MYGRPEVRKNRTFRLLDREWQAILDCADVLRGRDGGAAPRTANSSGKRWGHRGFAARLGEGAAAERFDPAILDGPGEPRSDL